MFTGIIEGVGRLAAHEPVGGDVRFTFEVGSLPFDNVQLGESIAVNGVCLTVIAFDAGSFQADASTETLGLTTLGSIATFDPEYGGAIDAPLREACVQLSQDLGWNA